MPCPKRTLKGIVHPNITFDSLFTHPLLNSFFGRTGLLKYVNNQTAGDTHSFILCGNKTNASEWVSSLFGKQHF